MEDTRKCTQCKRVFPTSCYISNATGNKKKKYTKKCEICRQSHAKSRLNPNTREGKMLIVRDEIRKLMTETKCDHCESTENLECNHIDPKTKTHEVLDPSWWSWNGGADGMWTEFYKCQVLCKPCHSLKTDEDRPNVETSPGRIARNKRDLENPPTALTIHKRKVDWESYINRRKKNRHFRTEWYKEQGECWKCGKLFDELNEHLFSSDHQPQFIKIYNISYLVGRPASLKKIKSELKKCKLACNNKICNPGINTVKL